MNNEDITRELRKILDTLTAVQVHLRAKDEMNAALHMSSEIRSTPLAAAVGTARANTVNLIDRLNFGGQTSGEWR